MSSNNFFDLTNGIDIFTIDTKVPAGFGVRALAGADFIVGSDRPDCVYGNDGADSISGGIGNDSLQGGRGADLLLGNAGADFLQGERGKDILYGGRNNDTLIGQEGDDFLAGGAGVDSLIGGGGSDVFVLSSADAVTNPALADTIADFNDEEFDFIALTDGRGEPLTETDVTLEANGTDTFIRLKAGGGILARVQGVTPANLTGLFNTVKATLDDTESGATVLSSIPGGTNVQGSVGDEDYIDFFQFQVAQASIVNLGLSGLTVDADLLLYKDLNDDGEVGGDEIISASERLGTANESIENITLDRGKYFLSVEAIEGNTNYSLSLAGVAGTVARDLAGDRPSTARLLPPDGEVELHDYVGGADAIDTYRLEVRNAGYLDLFTDNQKADVNLTLWSDRNNNNLLDANETIARGTNEIKEDSINPGTYFVNVNALGAATPYEIAAISDSGSRVETENYDLLVPGIPTTGSLTPDDKLDPNDEENYADFYLLPELGTGLTVTVTQQTSGTFDAYLTVVDLLTGEVVAKNNDINASGGDFNASLSFTTQPGVQYVVLASSVDAPGFGNYTLDAKVTGTPVANAVRNASVDELLPPPVFLEKGNRADTGLKEDTRHELVYAPLTGGLAQPIQISGLNQGQFGNCAFIAALAATFGKIEDPSTAASVTSPVLNKAFQTNGDNYTVEFYNYLTGNPVKVTVDNQVVTKDNSVFGARWDSQSDGETSKASNQSIWGSIAERAYAKFRGQETGRNGYDATGNGDQAGIALKRVTGKAIEEIGWNPFAADPNYAAFEFSDESGSYNNLGSITPDRIFQRIQETLNAGRYVATGTENDAEKRSGGLLVGGHAYSIHNAYEANGQRMILLRNPHGQDNSTDAKAPEDPSPNTKDGFLAITFDRFLKNFGGVSLSKE
jgi:Calpain family cysteine protease/RTX calcium-binding nonapeptide repeat (4 copies)